MSDTAPDPLALLGDAQDLLFESLHQLELLAIHLSGTHVDPYGLVGQLAQLHGLTRVEDWDAPFWVIDHWLAGVRTAGPFVARNERAASASRYVIEVVSTIDQSVYRHEPFGDAMIDFGTEFDLYQRDWGALTLGPTGLVSPAAEVAADGRVNPPAGDPVDEVRVMHDVWRVQDPAELASGVPEAVWAAARRLRDAWERGEAALALIVRAFRPQLSVVPLERLRVEVEWELCRAITEWELRRPNAARARPGGVARGVVRPPNMETRDAWIYARVMEETHTYSQIARMLRRVAPTRGWRILGSPEAIRQRAQRYAENNRLPPPRPRQNR